MLFRSDPALGLQHGKALLRGGLVTHLVARELRREPLGELDERAGRLELGECEGRWLRELDCFGRGEVEARGRRGGGEGWGGDVVAQQVVLDVADEIVQVQLGRGEVERVGQSGAFLSGRRIVSE